MTKSKIQLIYIELDEEIDFLLEKVEQSWSDNIVLIFPKGSYILNSLVNLRLLKNQIDDLGKNALMVIADKGGRWMVEQAGLESVDKLPDFEKMYGKGMIEESSVGADLSEQAAEELMEENKDEEEEVVVPDDEVLPEEFIKEKKEEIEDYWREEENIQTPKKGGFETVMKISRWSKWRPQFNFSFPRVFSKMYLGLAILAVVVAVATVYFVLPKATVEIVSKQESVSIPPITIVADKNLTEVDFGASKIPAQVLSVQVSDSKTFPATQDKKLGNKAVGSIMVFNEYSVKPQPLVATTRFKSPEGKVFRIQENVVVPGGKMVDGKLQASSISVAVIADQPGEEYNIPSTTFTIPGFEGTSKFNGFYGKSVSSMNGGGRDNAKVIAESDIKSAKNAFSGLADKALEELSKKTPDNLKLMDNSLEAGKVDYVFSKNAGEVADNFEAKATVVARVIAIDENAIKEIIKNIIAQRNTKGANNISIKEYSFNYSVNEVNLDKGQILFSVDNHETVAFSVDVAEFKKAIAGKSKEEANHIFSQMAEIQKVNVLFTPRWTKSFPSNENRISVKFVQE